MKFNKPKCDSDRSMRRQDEFEKKMLALRGLILLLRQGKLRMRMKTFFKCACLILLAAWAGSAASLAQTNSPSAATNQPAAAMKRPLRYGGKILTVDSNAKTIMLQGEGKVVIGLTDKTKIIKDKKPATFDVLAADQAVTGLGHKDAAGKWMADTLNVGDPRQPLAEPVLKTFVAPPKTNAVH